MSRRRNRRGAWLLVVALGLVAAGCSDESSSPAETTAEVSVTTEPDVQEVAEEVATTIEEATTVEETPPLTFPIELEGSTLPLLNVEDIEGGQLITISGALTSADDVRASSRFTLADLRIEGGSVECGGESHEGPFTVDTDMVTMGTVAIEAWGAIEIEFTETSTVFNAAVGPPFCDEQIGVWTGTEGEFEGLSGTVHRLRVDGWETVTISS